MSVTYLHMPHDLCMNLYSGCHSPHALSWVKPKGEILKCKAKFGYHLVLSLLMWKYSHLWVLSYTFILCKKM